MARDHAHVDLDRLGAADAADLALLQHAQELRLHLRPDVADLVEEQRAAAAPPRTGRAWRATAPVKAPLRVAEQLALEQRLGERGAVDRARTARRARGEWVWMARATSSLPVPDSPTTSTVDSVGATRATIL